MRITKRWLFPGLLIAALGSAWGLWLQPEITAKTVDTAPVQPAAPKGERTLASAATDDPNATPPAAESFAQALARELSAEFGARIDEVAIQARLYPIRRDVVERFPVNGLDDFNTAIREAFPDHATDILSLIDRLERYNNWLDRETTALMDLAPLKRNGTIWAKRRELFGDDADLLWADEHNELARKQDKVQTILAELGQARHSTLDETLYQLNSRLKETLGDDLAQYGDVDSVITRVFFGLASVQDRLATRPPAQRQRKIDDIRRQMGYSEDRIERLRERDQQRNRRWDNGLAYMKEREQRIAPLEGDARQQALEELRREYFGNEARTIRMEEENGFFRYERPRVFGRN